MSQTLELIIRARDEASAKLKAMGSSMDSLTEALKIGGAAALAYVAAVKQVGDLAKDYMNYAIAAGDFAEKTGMAVEEAAALLDLVKDMNVPITTLEMAFRSMARAGIEPSISGLMEVRSRLDDAVTPAEKLALAIKLMGRSGEDLIPILAQLNDQELRDLVGNLTDAQRITAAEYQEMLALRNEMAVFEDQVETVKLGIGAWAIETFRLNEVLKVMAGLLQGIGPYLDALANFHGIGSGQSTGLGRGSGPGGARAGTPTRADLEALRYGGGGAQGLSFMVGEHGAERLTLGTGGGTVSPANDQLAQAINRMVRTLPTILRDAIEKAK